MSQNTDANGAENQANQNLVDIQNLNNSADMNSSRIMMNSANLVSLGMDLATLQQDITALEGSINGIGGGYSASAGSRTVGGTNNGVEHYQDGASVIFASPTDLPQLKALKCWFDTTGVIGYELDYMDGVIYKRVGDATPMGM